tara:strand:- start:47 stop:382 length:336 start_codon:yes stop_codon:yes gene_type:complete
MKVKFTTPNGRVTAELEGDTQVEIFSQLSAFQEVFGETTCGKCGSDHTKFQIRNVEDNLYYELKCSDCGGKLAFGVMKKGGRLFPKRKNKDNEWLPDSGWVKWNSETKREE